MNFSKCFYKKIYYSLLISNMLSVSVTVLADMVDEILAGRLISEQAVSAVSLTSPLYVMIVFFGYLISVGGPMLYSRIYGSFEIERAHKFFGQMIAATAILGVICSLFFYFFSDVYYAFYDASPEVTAMAKDYFKFFVIVALIYPIYIFLYDIVYQDGDSNLCIVSNIVQMTTNIVVSIILVKNIGIEGLGIGTVCGIVASASLLVIHFFKKNCSIKFLFGWDWKLLWQSITLGLYSSSAYIFCMIISIIMNKCFIMYVGEYFLPAYSALGTIQNFATVFESFTTAAGPIISVYIGEKNIFGVKRSLKTAIFTSLLIGIAFTVIVEMIAPEIPEFLGITTPEVLKAATSAIRWGALSFPFLALFYTINGYCSLIDKPSISFITTIFNTNIFPIIFELIFAFIIGVNGVWIGFFVKSIMACAFIFLIILIKYGKEKFPYIIEESKDKTYIFDTNVDDESIVALRNNISDTLKNESVSEKSIKRIEFLFEEAMLQIKEKNPGKTVLSEVDLTVTDKIKLIIKDNGVLFNMTESDSKPISFSGFVFSLLMDHQAGKIYATTSGYNRNSFTFDK